MGKWILHLDDSYTYKAHLCTERNSHDIREYMTGRGSVIKESRVLDIGDFEPGGFGMLVLDRPRCTFDFLDQRIIIDASRVFELISDLRLAPVKGFSYGGKNYHYSISRFNVLVLDDEERSELLKALVAGLPEAQRQADAFSEAFEARWKKGEEEYKAKHGTDLPIIRVKAQAPTNAN